MDGETNVIEGNNFRKNPAPDTQTRNPQNSGHNPVFRQNPYLPVMLLVAIAPEPPNSRPVPF
jgi:hypothetical protein